MTSIIFLCARKNSFYFTESMFISYTVQQIIIYLLFEASVFFVSIDWSALVKSGEYISEVRQPITVSFSF